MNLDRWIYYAVHGSRQKNPRRRKPRRGPRRDPKFRAWISRNFLCACGCGRGPCHAAHTGRDGGMSMKPDDRTCIPLWWECHWEFDNGTRSGALFLEDHAIDLPKLVRGYNRDYDAEVAAERAA